MTEQSNAGFWLSPQQKSIWASQQRHPNSPHHAIALFEADTEIPAPDIKAAVTELVRRHDILRTVFRRQTAMKVPFQVVISHSELSWEERDFSTAARADETSSLDNLFREEQNRSLNLEQAPVLRAVLIKLPKRSALLLSLPAMCADSYSLQHLAIELGRRGPAVEPVEESLRYVQFAQWQKDMLEGDDQPAQDGRTFCQKQQSPDTLIEMPGETPSAGLDGFAPETLVMPLQSGLISYIQAAASRFGQTQAG